MFWFFFDQLSHWLAYWTSGKMGRARLSGCDVPTLRLRCRQCTLGRPCSLVSEKCWFAKTLPGNFLLENSVAEIKCNVCVFLYKQDYCYQKFPFANFVSLFLPFSVLHLLFGWNLVETRLRHRQRGFNFVMSFFHEVPKMADYVIRLIYPAVLC